MVVARCTENADCGQQAADQVNNVCQANNQLMANDNAWGLPIAQ